MRNASGGSREPFEPMSMIRDIVVEGVDDGTTHAVLPAGPRAALRRDDTLTWSLMRS